MHNLKEVINDNNAVVINSFDEIKNKEIRDILNNSGVHSNTRGIFYNSESEAAKNISNATVLNE